MKIDESNWHLSPLPSRERNDALVLALGRMVNIHGDFTTARALDVIDEYYPPQQPTTERPTEEGAFWYRNRPEDEWVLAEVKLLCKKLAASSKGCPIAWVENLTGEWLRIVPPASPIEKGE